MKSRLFEDVELELDDNIEDGVYNERCTDEDMGFDMFNVNDCDILESEIVEINV